MSDTSSRIERRRRFSSTELPGDSPQSPGEPAVTEPAPVPAGPPPSGPSLSDGGDFIWKEIDDYARSGVRVFVRDGSGEAEAFLHQTRRYNPRAIQWERYERWMRTDGTGTLNWKPIQYRTIS